MTHKIEHSFIIPENLAGLRLDQALAQLLPTYSRTQIKNWIDDGLVLVNDATVKGKVKVLGGESVSINATKKAMPAWEAEPIPLNIIYEDDAILIINKPAGLVVHPGAGNASSTLLNALLHHAPQLKDLPRAGILHRLDKDTTGLLAIAKTEYALKKLSSQLKKRLFLREYQTVVHGTFISGGKVDQPIDRHPRDRKRMSVQDTGKPSVTHYRLMEKYAAHTRLRIKLETGRTHQIRVHMNYIHHPVVGDPAYGGRIALTKSATPELAEALKRFKRQALHAYSLGFTHPVSGEWVQFECELPEDMQQLIQALKTTLAS